MLLPKTNKKRCYLTPHPLHTAVSPLAISPCLGMSALYVGYLTSSYIYCWIIR
jgi:hypothetical protein